MPCWLWWFKLIILNQNLIENLFKNFVHELLIFEHLEFKNYVVIVLIEKK